jgi:hypothetical protein
MQDSHINQSKDNDNDNDIDNDLSFLEDDIATYHNPNSIGSFNKNKKNPMQFISLENKNGNGIYNFNKECMDLLRSIEEEIILIVFSGKSQTGKSLIANLLINNNTFEGVKFKIKFKNKFNKIKISLKLRIIKKNPQKVSGFILN